MMMEEDKAKEIVLPHEGDQDHVTGKLLKTQTHNHKHKHMKTET